jgi:hypothetical protein
VRERRTLPVAEAIHYAKQIAAGLSAAHENSQDPTPQSNFGNYQLAPRKELISMNAADSAAQKKSRAEFALLC